MNVGSIKTSQMWRNTDDSIICLQETRVGRNNHRACAQEVAATGKHLFHGALLPGILRTDGHLTTTHGGTAILAPEITTRPFTQADDASNKFDSLVKTTRVCACWSQVTPTVRVLIFSVYARSGASANQELFDQNEALFKDVFEICSQFGDIPILIAGDFQTCPSNYPSIATALQFNRWFDPLQTIDSQGFSSRPLTYSFDGSFAGACDGCSSIDGILMNHVALPLLDTVMFLTRVELSTAPFTHPFPGNGFLCMVIFTSKLLR